MPELVELELVEPELVLPELEVPEPVEPELDAPEPVEPESLLELDELVPEVVEAVCTADGA